MTALDCVINSLSVLSSNGLSTRDGAILACLTRFNGTTRAQIGRIMKTRLPWDCMRLLVEKKLVRVEVVRNQANRNFITDAGARMVARMIGKEVANAQGDSTTPADGAPTTR